MKDIKVGDIITVSASGSFGVIVDEIRDGIIIAKEYNHPEYTSKFKLSDVIEEHYYNGFMDYTTHICISTEMWVDISNVDFRSNEK